MPGLLRGSALHSESTDLTQPGCTYPVPVLFCRACRPVETMKDDTKKMVNAMVEMEASYLTAEYFRLIMNVRAAAPYSTAGPLTRYIVNKLVNLNKRLLLAMFDGTYEVVHSLRVCIVGVLVFVAACRGSEGHAAHCSTQLCFILHFISSKLLTPALRICLTWFSPSPHVSTVWQRARPHPAHPERQATDPSLE